MKQSHYVSVKRLLDARYNVCTANLARTGEDHRYDLLNVFRGMPIFVTETVRWLVSLSEFLLEDKFAASVEAWFCSQFANAHVASTPSTDDFNFMQAKTVFGKPKDELAGLSYVFFPKRAPIAVDGTDADFCFDNNDPHFYQEDIDAVKFYTVLENGSSLLDSDNKGNGNDDDNTDGTGSDEDDGSDDNDTNDDDDSNTSGSHGSDDADQIATVSWEQRVAAYFLESGREALTVLISALSIREWITQSSRQHSRAAMKRMLPWKNDLVSPFKIIRDAIFDSRVSPSSNCNNNEKRLIQGRGLQVASDAITRAPRGYSIHDCPLVPYFKRTWVPNLPECMFCRKSRAPVHDT